MAKQLQFRRGTTAEHSSFTGAIGEITVDTTKDTLVVHDGVTAGGIPLEREGAGSMSASDILTAIKTVDGSGSGLDADTLDGHDTAYFATSSHNHSGVYQPAGTYNTIIGTDSDVSASGATVLSTMTFTDGVCQGFTTRSLSYSNIGAAAQKGTSTVYGGAKFSLSGTTLTITTT